MNFIQATIFIIFSVLMDPLPSTRLRQGEIARPLNFNRNPPPGFNYKYVRPYNNTHEVFRPIHTNSKKTVIPTDETMLYGTRDNNRTHLGTARNIMGSSPYNNLNLGIPESIVRTKHSNPGYRALDEPMLSDEPVAEPKPSAPQGILTTEQLAALDSQVNNHYFIGYSCKTPTRIEAISSHIRDPCIEQLTPTDEVEQTSTSKYQILQRERTREVPAFRCTLKRSLTSFYCGHVDHATPIPTETYVNRLIPMTVEDCRKLSTQGTYRAGDQKTYNGISEGEQRTISYFASGQTYVFSDIFATQISCSGKEVVIASHSVLEC